MKKVIAAVLMGTVLNAEFITGMESPVNTDYADKKQRLGKIYCTIRQDPPEVMRDYELRNAKSMMSKFVTDFNLPSELRRKIEDSNSFMDLRSLLFLMIKLCFNVN